MIQPLHWVSVVADIVACVVVGAILWRAFGRVTSSGKKALIALGTAALGFIVFFLTQTLLEIARPQERINGDIIAYDVNIFIAILAVLIIAMFFLRRSGTPDRQI